MKASYNTEDIQRLLASSDELEIAHLFAYAKKVKNEIVGNKVYLRGLIELSNQCSKDCYYCGIRCGNASVQRYQISEKEVVDLAIKAHETGIGSLVLQAGERSDKEYVVFVEHLLQKIMQSTNAELGITLSLGEQEKDTYKRWKEAGAKRYLLRIETSNEELYKKLHPENHSYTQRLKGLEILKKLNYQVGTGVMIGLPFQTIADLADDILFFKNFDVDMIGMGPYIPHEDTPLYQYSKEIPTGEERLLLSLKMVALTRIILQNVNIAATTAMQTLDPQGREQAIQVGANVIMPNLTPAKYRENYFLYQGKPKVADDFNLSIKTLEQSLAKIGAVIAYREHGDSKHFASKNNQK